MKKIISVFFALLVLASFAIPVSATSQEFTVTIPDYLEKVTDTQWFTDDYMINGERSQLTVSIAFYPITEKEKQAFLIASPYLSDTKTEIEKEPLFKEFVVAPTIKTTATDYQTVYTSYIKEASAGEYSACYYYFFSGSQKCVVGFNSTSPDFVTLDEAEKIINTLSFSGNFRKKIEYVPNYEIPTMPEIEFYTHQEIVTRDIEEVESEIKSNAIKTGVGTAAVFAVIAIVVVLIIKAAQKGKGGKKLTTAEKVAQLTKEQQDKLYKIGKIALIVSGTFFVICLSAAVIFLSSMSGSDPIDIEKIKTLTTVAVVVMFVMLGAIAAIKGRYPYWSDSNWFYLIKMRKGKVPQVSADSQVNAVSHPSAQAEVPQLDAVISKYAAKCDWTVQQQREWLGVLSKTISTITLGGGPAGADRFLQPHELEEAGNMLNTVGRTAFFVSRMLHATNMEKALKTDSVIDLVRTYCILNEYSGMLKEPHRSVFNEPKAYIYNVLKNADLTKLPMKEKENLLYWVPVVFYGDSLNPQTPDYNIHVFPQAGMMINGGAKIPCDTPLPEGYNFEKTPSGKSMHLRTIVNPSTGTEMVPLFTDVNLLFKIFSPNTPIGIVDYETACGMCLKEQGKLSGLVINPGKESKVIPVSQLAQPQPYEQTLSFEGPQKDKKAIAKKTSTNRIIGVVLLVLFALALYGATLQADFGGKFADIFFGGFNGSSAHNIGTIVGKLGVYIGMFFAGVYCLFKKEE